MENSYTYFLQDKYKYSVMKYLERLSLPTTS